jgi:type IX secretion system PorP/SprF family membrane protein
LIRSGFIYETRGAVGYSKKDYFDLNAGLFLYTKSVYGGIAAFHLTQPDEGFVYPSELPMKFAFNAGANFNLSDDKVVLSPTILYMKQQDFNMIMPGVTAKMGFVVLGISYRNDDAFNTKAGVQFKSFKAGYSYDYTISAGLRNNTGGSHELQLSWFIDNKKKSSKIKTIRMI